jgi:hypothetical protein
MFRAAMAVVALGLACVLVANGQVTDEEKEFLKKRWIKTALDKDSEREAAVKAIDNLLDLACKSLYIKNLTDAEAKAEFNKYFSIVLKAKKLRTDLLPGSFEIAMIHRANNAYFNPSPKDLAKNQGFKVLMRGWLTIKDAVPDSAIDLAIAGLPKADYLNYFDFLEHMGERSLKAVPRLEKLRDGKDEQIALRALRALKKVQAKK